MVEAAAGVFTVGVFQDVAWATKGLDALRRAGFASESLTVMLYSVGVKVGVLPRRLPRTHPAGRMSPDRRLDVSGLPGRASNATIGVSTRSVRLLIICERLAVSRRDC